ncbi:Type III restriction enzyme res subunit SNF2 family N terminal domain [Trypanosoma vivax]|uniref:Putative SNF2 DNA repair protein n=1 Tax=Trypanosoma vivax (strain Y486) TaxID=1055687 RepID=G0TTN2_TRYVY|nr:putative SNF2 DNA repair protein [Trypanosoma vivax]KAH8607194.1 Type III restriction enzyme res subunit SNF2 family N terminal domain [Trypanosoma vivax]CCC47313.1 putative SNF2 DNA repair protein [Trypanosoma vivax Y486]
MGDVGNEKVVAEGRKSKLILPPQLEAVLHPHQISALHFVWHRLVDEGIQRLMNDSWGAPLEKLVQLSQEVFGCVIGHSMGLGKTLTALCFVYLLQKRYASDSEVCSDAYRGNKTGRPHVDSSEAGKCTVVAPSHRTSVLRVLVLSPRSCTYQWLNSVEEWVRPELFGNTHLPVYAPLGSRQWEEDVVEFHRSGGILFLGYEEYMKMTLHAKGKSSKRWVCARVASQFDSWRQPLPLNRTVDMLDMLEAFDMVILDEAHRLKKPNSKLVWTLMEHLRLVQLRLALTGTPLQNHLDEYNVMHGVVTGRTLDASSFRRLFTLPIERGRCVDSTYEQFIEMQNCVATLRDFFADTVHLCGPEVLMNELPERREYVVLVGLSPSQEDAYNALLKRHLGHIGKNDVFSLHHEASHVCFHAALTVQLANAISRLPIPTVCHDNTSVVLEHEANGSEINSVGTRQFHSNQPTNSDNVGRNGDRVDDVERCSEASSRSSSPRPQQGHEQEEQVDVEAMLKRITVTDSPKLLLTLSLVLRIVSDLREKVVLFSLYRSHLYLLQRFLQQRGVAADIVCGSTEVKERRRIIERFTDDPERRIILCSTKASGVGINLVAANHCILFDVSWNPADDIQATYRLYRYGQKRPVTVYRIATDGTFEHVVFFYALSKSWLHKKIVDVMDPTRYERHMKDNFYVYPCPLPCLFGESNEKVVNRCHLPNSETLQKKWRDYARSCCPALALTSPDNTFAWIRSITEYSFLVRDDSEEVSKVMAERFEVQNQRQRMPVVIADATHTECTSVDGVTASPLKRCEDVLLSSLHMCAEHMVSMATRHQQMRRVVLGDAGQGSVPDTLTTILSCAVGAVKPDEGLEGIMVLLYHRGVEHVMQEALNKPSYAGLRALLTARAANDRRSRGTLRDVLCYRPFALFGLLSQVEMMHVLTELGLTRLFVPHCTILGMSLALRGGRLSDDALRVLYLLFSSANADGRHMPLTSASEVEQAVLHCMEEHWPQNGSVALLTSSVTKEDIVEKRRLLDMALKSAREHASGFITTNQAARFVGAQPVVGRRDVYRCQRCTDGVVERVPPEFLLKCVSCHCSVEFEVQTRTGTHHACTLYQMSVVCELLGNISHSRSFRREFIPSSCRGLLHALGQLQKPPTVTSEGSQDFILNALQIGIDVFLSGIPESTLQLMRIQCGVTSTEALRGLLIVDSSSIWSSMLQAHVREKATEWLKSTMTKGTEMLVGRMPEVLIRLALQSLARKYESTVGYARDLYLLPLDAFGGAQSTETVMLRFMCNGLVNLNYAERLLARPLTRAALDAFRMDNVTPSSSSASNDTAISGNASTTKGREQGPGVRWNDAATLSVATSRASSPSHSSVSVSYTERHPRAMKRRRSQSLSLSCSTDVAGEGTSSTYCSMYSEDDVKSSLGSVNRAESATAPTAVADVVEAEEVHMVRSTHYWAAHCEVYGTSIVESQTVMCEDEENGVSILQPLSRNAWTTGVRGATRDGMQLSRVADIFFDKILALAGKVRVIK